MSDDASPRHLVAKGTQTASFWIDESGSKTTANDCFVMGMIKTRHPDDLQRAIHVVRDKNNYRDELKFGRIKDSNYRIYSQVVDVLEESDAHIAATVINADQYDPFKGQNIWAVHAEIIGQLVVGNLNKTEICSIFMDVINTPADTSMGRLVKRKVNGLLRAPSVVTAVSLNSKSNDLLQAADLVAGAVFYERFSSKHSSNEHKTKIAKRLAVAFGVVDLSDQRTPRVNVATLRAPRKSRSGRILDPKRAAPHS